MAGEGVSGGAGAEIKKGKEGVGSANGDEGGVRGRRGSG